MKSRKLQTRPEAQNAPVVLSNKFGYLICLGAVCFGYMIKAHVTFMNIFSMYNQNMC